MLQTMNDLAWARQVIASATNGKPVNALALAIAEAIVKAAQADEAVGEAS